MSHLGDTALLRGPPELPFPTCARKGCSAGLPASACFSSELRAASAPGHMWLQRSARDSSDARGSPGMRMLSGTRLCVCHQMLEAEPCSLRLMRDAGCLEIAISTLHRIGLTWLLCCRLPSLLSTESMPHPNWTPLSSPLCLKTYLGSSAVIYTPKYNKVHSKHTAPLQIGIWFLPPTY